MNKKIILIGNDNYDKNIPFVENLKLNNTDKILFNNLDSYFKKLEDNRKNFMISVISRSSEISLRLIEWVINNYKVYSKIYIHELGKYINIYNSYKMQISNYGKKNFDPFRRNKSLSNTSKFYYAYDINNSNCYILTTIGQLNFFKWLFMNHIDSYIIKNNNLFIQYMNKSNIEKRKIPKKKEKIILDVSESTILYI